MKELELFRSQRFMFYVTLFTVIALAPNTYYVFHKLSVFNPIYRELFSLFVAAVIAGAIMLYTVRKNIPVALNFAYFEVVLASYYYISTIGFDWALIPALGFAMILPYSVSKSAEEIDRIALIEEEPRYMQMAGRGLREDAPEELKEAEAEYEKKVNAFMDKNPTKRPAEYWYNKHLNK